MTYSIEKWKFHVAHDASNDVLAFYSILLCMYIVLLHHENKDHCEINNNYTVTSPFHHKTKQHRTSLNWTEQHCGSTMEFEWMRSFVVVHWLIWTLKHLALWPQVIKNNQTVKSVFVFQSRFGLGCWRCIIGFQMKSRFEGCTHTPFHKHWFRASWPHTPTRKTGLLWPTRAF